MQFTMKQKTKVKNCYAHACEEMLASIHANLPSHASFSIVLYES